MRRLGWALDKFSYSKKDFRWHKEIVLNGSESHSEKTVFKILLQFQGQSLDLALICLFTSITLANYLFNIEKNSDTEPWLTTVSSKYL